MKQMSCLITKKRLVVVTYCIHFEVLVQLDAEAPIII